MPPQRRPRNQLAVSLMTYQPEVRAFFATPWAAELDALCTIRHSLSDHDAPATTIRRERQLLTYDLLGSPERHVSAIPRALLPAAQALLSAANVPYSVLSLLVQLPHIPHPDAYPSERTPAWLPPILTCVVHNWECLVTRGPGAPSSRRIVEWMVRSFPTASIAIVSENQAECAAIEKWLARRNLPIHHLRGGGNLSELKNRVVGTCCSGQAQDLAHRDIVIFSDARHALGERGRMLIEYAPKARLIGICRRNDRFSPWERDWLFALFGTARLMLSARSVPGADVPPSADRNRVLRRFLNSRPRGNYGT